MWAHVVAALVLALAATVQSASGFGFSLMAVPLLSLVIDPKTAVVVVAVIGPLLTISITFSQRRHILLGVVMVLTASAFVGMPLGLWILSEVSGRVLEAIIAVVVIAMTALLALGYSAPNRRHVDVIAGLSSGVLATSTGSSGPPLVFALQAKGVTPDEFRGTLSATFVLQGLIALCGFALVGRLNTEVGGFFLAGLPGMLGGFLVGAGVRPHLDPRRFRVLVLGLLMVTGISLLLQTFFG